MDVSVNWLRALAPNIEGTPQELADDLSMQAVPVDRVTIVGEGLQDIVVARVVSVAAHPNANRLTLCKVDAGAGQILDVVCGAPNVVEGALYPFVPAGGALPGGFEIERRKIRGETSNGMLCSEKELGLGTDAAGIMRLSDEHRPGEPLAQALDLPDARLEIDLTPNRIDLACHLGVARELAPGGEADLRLPGFDGPAWEPDWVSGVETASAAGVGITIEDPERCFRYLGAVVRGVRVGLSPEWLQARLRSAGSRPINNVVDSTNYVLLELNQPLHAFDLGRIRGGEIGVRAARGEPLVTLDGETHELGSQVTVIADAEGPVALAGVMGGAESEVTWETTDILIECAAFGPLHTRHTARAMGLATDASYRFERGIDETGLERAIRRCVELILATAGGTAAPQGIRVGRQPAAARHVPLRPVRVRQVLGLRLSVDQIAGLLEPLGFETATGAGDGSADVPTAGLLIRVPGWRVDVRREVDLLEEVARRYGYESFPHEARSFRPSVVPDSAVWRRADRVRSVLAGMGFLEARSAAFVGESRTSGRPVSLLKPLSAAEGFLRTDLVPVLVGLLEHNYTRGRRDVRLYEIGTVFALPSGPVRSSAEGGGPPAATPFVEEMRVGAVLTGARHPRHWGDVPADLDVWDLKGTIEELCQRLGLGDVRATSPPDEDTDLAFGVRRWLRDESFCIFGTEGLVGVAGRVRDEVVDAPPWSASSWALEFRLAAVRLERFGAFEALPTFPAVTRDLAFLISAEVGAAEVAREIREAAPETLESLRLFDVYEGGQIAAGRKSLAWHLVFRDPDRTLTDADVEAGMSAVIRRLEASFDVRVRSS
jgi:phenylalanyl-tRNA synthetase beta chain